MRDGGPPGRLPGDQGPVKLGQVARLLEPACGREIRNHLCPSVANCYTRTVDFSSIACPNVFVVWHSFASKCPKLCIGRAQADLQFEMLTCT